MAKQLKLNLHEDKNQKKLEFKKTLPTGEVRHPPKYNKKDHKGYLPNHHAIHHQI